MKKFSEMTSDERILELAKRQVMLEQQKARYKAWKLEQKLKLAKLETQALDETAEKLGTNGLRYNAQEMERAEKALNRAVVRSERAAVEANRRADEVQELMRRWDEMFPLEAPRITG